MAVSMSFGDYTFDPVPIMSLNISEVRDETGNLINLLHTATLQGTLVSLNKPNQGPANLVNQINTMRGKLADCSGCQQFLLTCEGETLIDTYAHARDLTFTESVDNWVFTANYSVQIEWSAVSDNSLRLAASGSDISCLTCLTATNESWDISQVENPAQYTATGTCPTGVPILLNITHNLTAKGYNCCVSGVMTEGYVAAKRWVEARLGFTDTILSDISGSTFRLTPTAFVAYNHNRQVSINKSVGEYSVTENWTLIGDSGATPYFEDYTVEKTTDQSSRFSNVSINGTITGLETRNFVHTLQASKWQNAMVGWVAVEPQIYSRASCLGGTLCPLATTPVSTSVSKNPSTGTINYSYNYSSKLQLVSGSISEQVNVSDRLASVNAVSVPIIGRRAGPLVYDTGSNNELERSVSINVLMSQPTGCFGEGTTTCEKFNYLFKTPPTGTINSLLCCLELDLSGTASKYYTVSNTQEWNPIDGQYNRNVVWRYQIFCSSGSIPTFC